MIIQRTTAVFFPIQAASSWMLKHCQTTWRGVLSTTEEEPWNGGKQRGRKGPSRQWTASQRRQPVLKNKTSSCLSLVAQQTPQHFLLPLLLLDLTCYDLCHCSFWFTAFWCSATSFFCITISGNAQEKARDVKMEKHFQCTLVLNL